MAGRESVTYTGAHGVAATGPAQSAQIMTIRWLHPVESPCRLSILPARALAGPPWGRTKKLQLTFHGSTWSCRSPSAVRRSPQRQDSHDSPDGPERHSRHARTHRNPGACDHESPTAAGVTRKARTRPQPGPPCPAGFPFVGPVFRVSPRFFSRWRRPRYARPRRSRHRATSRRAPSACSRRR